MAEYASQEAAAALDRAQKLSSTVRDGTRWYVGYQLIYGCASAVLVLCIGLLSWPYGMAIGIGSWCATITGLSVYAARQRVARRGFGGRHGIMIASWGCSTARCCSLAPCGSRGPWRGGFPAQWWLPFPG